MAIILMLKLIGRIIRLAADISIPNATLQLAKEAKFSLFVVKSPKW
jgi:hypothetical protein